MLYYDDYAMPLRAPLPRCQYAICLPPRYYVMVTCCRWPLLMLRYERYGERHYHSPPFSPRYFRYALRRARYDAIDDFSPLTLSRYAVAAAATSCFMLFRVARLPLFFHATILR